MLNVGAKMFGRFHAVRVVFGSTIIILCVIIFYQNFYRNDSGFNRHPGAIRLPVEAIQETWMSLEEFVQLARANKTCPVRSLAIS
jgi:hypothetical protein